jgi:hypothetical protein
MGQFPVRANREFFEADQGIKSAYQGNSQPDQGKRCLARILDDRAESRLAAAPAPSEPAAPGAEPLRRCLLSRGALPGRPQSSFLQAIGFAAVAGKSGPWASGFRGPLRIGKYRPVPQRSKRRGHAKLPSPTTWRRSEFLSGVRRGPVRYRLRMCLDPGKAARKARADAPPRDPAVPYSELG